VHETPKEDVWFLETVLFMFLLKKSTQVSKERKKQQIMQRYNKNTLENSKNKTTLVFLCGDDEQYINVNNNIH